LNRFREMAYVRGLHTTLVQKLSLTYYTHNSSLAQSRLAQPAGQPASLHHRGRGFLTPLCRPQLCVYPVLYV
jgi:hypothetical protein